MRSDWKTVVLHAAGLGFLWGGAGLVPGFLMEGVDPHGRYVDIWPAVFAIPLLFGGATFSLLLRVAERGRRLSEVSIPRALAWGALSGPALTAVFGFAMFVGFGEWHGEPPHPALRIAAVAGLSVEFALAACVTVLVARKSDAPPTMTPYFR